MKYIIETERCWLREMKLTDANFLVALNEHPDVFRFTTDPPFQSAETAAIFILNYNHYLNYGFGRWIIELKTACRPVGWCGLHYLTDENETDLGYRLLPEFWGVGIAAECGIACIRFAASLGKQRIVSRIHPNNKRSIRVAEKIGMRYEGNLIYEGAPWLNYVINPNENP